MGQPTDSPLTEHEAQKLVHDLIEYAMRLLSTASGQPPSPEEMIRMMKVGIGVLKFATPILGDFSPLAKAPEGIADTEALISSHPPAEVIQTMENLMVKEIVKSGPEEVTKFRAAVDKMREWSQRPTWPREALVGFAKQQWPGKPGPTAKVPKEVYPELPARAISLRPVCEMVLDLAGKSNQPLASVVQAVMTLKPDWERECTFMLSHEGLVREALQTAKIKRALRARSKANLLADALACTYAGFPASPSYSIQVVAEARRLGRR